MPDSKKDEIRFGVSDTGLQQRGQKHHSSDCFPSVFVLCLVLVKSKLYVTIN